MKLTMLTNWLISGTTMHQIALFHVRIFKNFLGWGLTEPPPQTPPPAFSRASPSMLGLRPQCLQTKECISDIIPALLFFHFEPWACPVFFMKFGVI